MADSRRDVRVSINKKFDSFEQLAREYATDISRSGTFIKTDHPLPVGTKVNLRFSVVTSEAEVIEGLGEVVRVSEEPSGMGVTFCELSDASKRSLQRILDPQQEADEITAEPLPIEEEPVPEP
ncbi:MAG: PilZ domain-containing protein [Polyangiaceae bacterium]|nr:PilZ domain-containing protein [Polyangiaceae bacterium]